MVPVLRPSSNGWRAAAVSAPVLMLPSASRRSSAPLEVASSRCWVEASEGATDIEEITRASSPRRPPSFDVTGHLNKDCLPQCYLATLYYVNIAAVSSSSFHHIIHNLLLAHESSRDIETVHPSSQRTIEGLLHMAVEYLKLT